MTKRLQVRLDDVELRTIQRLVRRERLKTAEWVRRQLLEGAAAASRRDTASKLAPIHAAHRIESPAPEIDEMLEEIERGYRAGSSSL